MRDREGGNKSTKKRGGTERRRRGEWKPGTRRGVWGGQNAGCGGGWGGVKEEALTRTTDSDRRTSRPTAIFPGSPPHALRSRTWPGARSGESPMCASAWQAPRRRGRMRVSSADPSQLGGSESARRIRVSSADPSQLGGSESARRIRVSSADPSQLGGPGSCEPLVMIPACVLGVLYTAGNLTE